MEKTLQAATDGSQRDGSLQPVVDPGASGDPTAATGERAGFDHDRRHRTADEHGPCGGRGSRDVSAGQGPCGDGRCR